MANKKTSNPPEKSDKNEFSYSLEDYMQFVKEEILDKMDESYLNVLEQSQLFVNEEENRGYDDKDYPLGLELPRKKFIGKPQHEFHIRFKLNQAPVNIWRELVVPSNITLELLAFVLIDAMGWGHEHLYQFVGKNNGIT